MSSRFHNIGFAIVLAAIASACKPSAEVVAHSATLPALRVCADPNNLPFSNQRGEGFENKLAELAAAELGAKVEYVWWAQRRGFLRNTLRAGECDVVMGMPAGITMAATTTPYYRSTYAFVTREGDHAPDSLDDPWLKHALVGVQLIGDDGINSPPAHALSNRGVIQNVRGYSVYGNYVEPNPPARVINAVAQRDIDVAIAWGPLAGYFAGRSTPPLHVTPLTASGHDPQFEFDISMAVARDNTELLQRLNGVIDRNRRRINELLQEYAVPTLPPRTEATK